MLRDWRGHLFLLSVELQYQRQVEHLSLVVLQQVLALQYLEFPVAQEENKVSTQVRLEWSGGTWFHLGVLQRKSLR